MKSMKYFSMFEILPLFVTLNVHSANFLHWLHHFCQGFGSFFGPIWIKFEIISPPNLSDWINSKIIESALFTICELKSWSRRLILYLGEVMKKLTTRDLYLSFRWMIFLFISMKYPPVVGFDWIFGNIFSEIRLNPRQKQRLTEIFSWFLIYGWICE